MMRREKETKAFFFFVKGTFFQEKCEFIEFIVMDFQSNLHVLVKKKLFEICTCEYIS